MSQAHDAGNAAEMRRTRIMEAAAAVFAQKGFQRATVREIAAQAGIAPGTIYLYFENKRDLLVAIADHLISQPLDQVLSRGAEMDAQTLMAAILRERMRFARQNRALLKALIPEIWVDAELQDRFFSRIMAPIFASGAGFLRRRIAEGELRPCRVEVVLPAIAGAIIFLAAARALMPAHVLAGISEDEIVEELTRLYMLGLRPDDSEPAE